MADNECFGIYWYHDKDDNQKHYRCRGIGKTYDQFYRSWVPASSYRCTGIDFPWDFFVFDDPADHDRLIADFGSDSVKED